MVSCLGKLPRLLPRQTECLVVYRRDFFVLSAGINTDQYGIDSDDIDPCFGVNWLGHFYVCNQLWPLLRKTGKLGEKPVSWSQTITEGPSWL